MVDTSVASVTGRMKDLGQNILAGLLSAIVLNVLTVALTAVLGVNWAVKWRSAVERWSVVGTAVVVVCTLAWCALGIYTAAAALREKDTEGLWIGISLVVIQLLGFTAYVYFEIG